MVSPTLTDGHVVRKMQDVDSISARHFVLQDLGCAVMLEHFSQTGTDGREEVLEVQMSDHCVVHFEQKLHSVPFIGQLLLGRLDVLKIKRIVNGHGHLSCNLTEEAKVRVLIGSISDTADGHSSQASMRGTQRQTKTGRDVICTQPLHRPWKARFPVYVVNKKRLLRLPNKTCKRFADRQLSYQFSRSRLFQNMYPHQIAVRIVQPHA